MGRTGERSVECSRQSCSPPPLRPRTWAAPPPRPPPGSGATTRPPPPAGTTTTAPLTASAGQATLGTATEPAGVPTKTVLRCPQGTATVLAELLSVQPTLVGSEPRSKSCCDGAGTLE